MRRIYEGVSAAVNVATGDEEGYEKNIENIQKVEKRAGQIAAVERRINPDTTLGQIVFDIASQGPVMATALVGAYGTAKLLTTVGIPTWIAGYIGYAGVDAMLEGGNNFADVLTDPKMMIALEKILGHKPSNAELSNISEGVGKILSEKATESSRRVAIGNLFNPLNLIESRLLPGLGGKTFLGRSARRGVFETGEETTQSVGGQASKEMAVADVEALSPEPEGVPEMKPGAVEAFKRVDYGQALYEGMLGGVAGPIVSAPQTYLGLRADRQIERELEGATVEMNQIIQQKKDFKANVERMLATGNLRGVDEILLEKEDWQKDFINSVIEDAKKSEDPKIASNAQNYTPGTHLKNEVESDGQTTAQLQDMDWQFREEYIEARDTSIKTPMQQYMLIYANNVKNPSLKEFQKRWAQYKKVQLMKGKVLQDGTDQQPQTRSEADTQTGGRVRGAARLRRMRGEQPEPAPTGQPQSQPQPATSEKIQEKTQEIQESLEQPALSIEQGEQQPPSPVDAASPPIISDRETDSRDVFKEVQNVFIFVLGKENVKDRINKTIQQAVNRATPTRTEQVLSRNPENAKLGKMVPGKFLDGRTKKSVARTALSELVDNDVISPEEAYDINRYIDIIRDATPTQAQPVQVLTDEAQDLIATIDQGGMPTSINNNMRRIAEENGVEVLSDDTPADLVQKLRDVAEEEQLAATRDEQMERTEPPVSPEEALRGDTESELDARSKIREVLETSTGASKLTKDIRNHVESLMKADDKFNSETPLNPQTIDSQVDIFNANLISEILSGLKQIEGVSSEAIPERYTSKRSIRSLVNPIFGKGGRASSLRPSNLENLGTPEESQARKDHYVGILTDPDYVAPDQLDRSQLDKLQGGRTATDDKGMAFIDQSTSKVILEGGTIPEGTVIRVTTAGSKDRRGKMYRWTGRKPKAGDREPGMWYLAEFDGKNYRPVLDTDKLRTGETFDKGDDPFVRDDLWKETIRVNPDNKRGENMTAAFLQLRDNPDKLSVTQGKTVYQLAERGPGAEMPEPSGVGAVSGKLSPEDQEMLNRINDNNRTVRQFSSAQMAIREKNNEKLSDLERANDELFSQEGFQIDSQFDEEGLSFVITPEMEADPKFRDLVKRLGFQEIERQPLPDGSNMVKYGPPEPIKPPKFERDTTPQPRDYGMPGEDPMNQGGYGQKMNKYSSLLKKRGSGKGTTEDMDKAVDAMPEWLKDMIKTEPKVALMKKQEMINLITSDLPSPANEITLPESLRPKETDTDRVVDAKNKIIDAIWEASSSEYATTDKAPPVRYSNMPKLWMVLNVLKNPKTASAAMRKFLEFESASNMRNMTPDQMEIELMNLETLIDTQMPNMQETLEEAVQQELLATEELQAIEGQYDQIIEDYKNAREEINNKADALTPEQFADLHERERENFIRRTSKALEELDTAGATKDVKDAKTRVENLTREIAEVSNNFDTLSTQYQEALQNAKENATEGIYADQRKQSEKEAEAAAIKAKKGKYPDVITINDVDIKASNSYPLKTFTTQFVKQVRFRMGKKGLNVPKEEINKVTDKKVLPWLENWLLENPDRILGKRVLKGDIKLYPDRPRTSTGDLNQWVIDLADTYIQEQTQSIRAGKVRGEVGFSAADILGKSYKKPSQDTDIEDFVDATVLPEQIQGQYQLDVEEITRFSNEMSKTEWWDKNPDGLSIDNIVNTQNIDWTTPPENKSDPRVLKPDHAIRFIHDALVRSAIPKKRLTQGKTAQRMFTDLKDLTYDYLKGLATYGRDSVFEENNSAARIGLINKKQFETIEDIASNNTDAASKKKL